MRDYQSRLMIGHIKKEFLYNSLRDNLKAIEATPIVQDENATYCLGYQFGQIDTLKKIIDQLESMPTNDPNEKAYLKIAGRPETWPPD